jgi:hypothetical protein
MYPMKRSWLRGSIFLVAIFLLVAALRHLRIQAATPLKKTVVVELFTSEGCSSCPPADDLLGHLRQEPNANAAEVIPLGFHVDYWDHQGWRDRFDSPAYTRRQQEYAKSFHLESPYTPQIVVDGAVEFVGNDTERAGRAITAAGAQNPASRVELSSTDGENLDVAISGASSGEVMLVVTEDNLATNVAAGENDGRTLHHSAVVRDFRRIGRIKDRSFAATVPLTIAHDWKRHDLRAVVFVQETGTGKILGAASRPVSSLSRPN